MNATKFLQDRIRTAFTPDADQPLDAGGSTTLIAASPDTFDDLDLAQRLAVVRGRVRGRVVLTTSFGIEDQAITHEVFRNNLAIEVVTLDTGRLFPQTYDVWVQTERLYGRRIPAFYPDHASLEALIVRQGINGFYDSLEARHSCCAIRKLDPLRRALAGAIAWITGLRADQSEDRAGTTFAAVDRDHHVIKVNPLFDWTRDKVFAFVRENRIPYNTLHDQGFPSIGCAPCTRAIGACGPERAGRWWWERHTKKECGLHVAPTGPSQSATPSSPAIAEETAP